MLFFYIREHLIINFILAKKCYTFLSILDKSKFTLNEMFAFD